MKKEKEEMKTENNRLRAVTAGVMICFFLFGYCDSVRGATLTDVTSAFKVSYGVGGALMLVHYIGYCASSLFFGSMTGKIHRRTALIVSNVNIAAGIFIYTCAPNIYIFLIGILLIGFSLGLYEYAGNTAVADIYPEEKRGKYTNLVAGMHGIGAIIGPAAFGVILRKGGDYKTAFMIILPVILAAVLLFLNTGYPKQTYLNDSPLRIKDILGAMLIKKAGKYYALATLYIATEAGIITWITAFFVDEKGQALKQAALWLSLFFVFLTAGRFIGSMYVDRFGIRRVLIVHFALSALCIILGVTLPGEAAVLLPLSGLFLSVIFPTLGAGISVECHENTAVTMGAFFAFAALGGAGGSWAIGLFSQILGTRAGIGSTAVICLAALLIVHKTVR